MKKILVNVKDIKTSLLPIPIENSEENTNVFILNCISMAIRSVYSKDPMIVVEYLSAVIDNDSVVLEMFLKLTDLCLRIKAHELKFFHHEVFELRNIIIVNENLIQLVFFMWDGEISYEDIFS